MSSVLELVEKERWTDRESFFLSLFARKPTWTLAELRDETAKVYGTESKNAVIVLMRYFSAKTAPHGWVVTKTGGIGRYGEKVSYTIDKKF